MADLPTISRVLYDHNWISIAEWADTFRLLADLSDDQIDEITLVGPHRSPDVRCRRTVGLSPPAR
jgi:hypothetical protein